MMDVSGHLEELDEVEKRMLHAIEFSIVVVIEGVNHINMAYPLTIEETYKESVR